MISYQGIIIAVAVAVCACDDRTKSSDLKVKKKRELTSFSNIETVPYESNVDTVLHGYYQGHADVNAYQTALDHGYDAGLVELQQQPYYGGYEQYPIDGVKRYAVKEEVDEGYVTTTRPVYLPRMTTRAPPTPDQGWRPIITNTPRPATGKSLYVPNYAQNTNHIELPIHPSTSFKTNYVPVEKVVEYPVPQPYTLPVYQPYPVAVPQPYPVSVPVPVHVHSTVEVPVEKPVPVPVIKHVPYNVVKNEHVPVPLPYPVPVPLYKTKYVVHTKTK